MRACVVAFVVAGCAFAVACSDGMEDPGPNEDGGQGADAGAHDSGVVTGDAGAGVDAGPADAGGGGGDAASTDAGAGDAGSADGGTHDAGSHDAGQADAGSGDTGNVDAPRLDSTVEIAEVALFQAVKVPLGLNGQPVTPQTTAIVAGREALVRMYVKTQAPVPRPVACEVVVKDGAAKAVFTGSLNMAAASTDAALSSTCNVTIPAANMTSGAALSARLVGGAPPVPAGTAHAARFPTDGAYHDVRAEATGGPIRLVLVPMKYDTDGSGRLPDAGPQMLDAIRTAFTSMYPADSIDIVVHDPVPWSKSLTWTGNVNFGTLNQLLSDLKATDNAPNGDYYYGMITPASSYAGYCGGSCVTGQGWVVDDPADGSIRAASGVAFDVVQASGTCAHETGHMHGREHAPCGTSGEANYPYSGGLIGVWGWDPAQKALYAPDVYSDFMGYCDDQWISDYTWNGIFERIRAVNALPPPPVDAVARPHRFLDLHPDGTHVWGRTVSFKAPPRGRRVALDVVNADAAGFAVDAALLRHSHGSGVTLVLDGWAAGAAQIQWRGGWGIPAMRIPVEGAR